MMYIIDSKNKTKFKALMLALGQSSEEQISIRRIIAENAPDVRPLSVAEAKNAATEGVNALVRSFLNDPDRSTEAATAICLQKGAAVSDREHPELICVIAMRRTDTPAIHFAYCDPIPLDQRIKSLVTEGVEIYDAYGEVYGAEVREKKISLHEKISSTQTEIEWMSEGIKNVLAQK